MYIYINLNIIKVKKHRVWERYDSIFCGFPCLIQGLAVVLSQ